MAMSDYSLSDIAAASSEGTGGMGGAGWWLIILFAMMFGWGNGGLGGANGQPVTESGLCNAMNYNNLENAVGRLSDQMWNQTEQLQGTLHQNDSNLSQGLSLVQQQLSSISSDTLRSIDQTNASMAQATAAINGNLAAATASINATTNEQTQKILDALSTNRMADMQNQINQLQLQNALGDVVRYPTAFTYSSGNNPFCGCSCGASI